MVLQLAPVKLQLRHCLLQTLQPLCPLLLLCPRTRLSHSYLQGTPRMLIGQPDRQGEETEGKGTNLSARVQRPIPKGEQLLTGSSYATGPGSPLQAVRLVQLWAPGLLCWLSVDHMTAVPPEPVC